MERDFKKITTYVEREQNVEAKNFMVELASALRQELHASVVDQHLLNIFDESCGLLYFIEATVNKKKFSDAIAESLEILCTLVNNFTSELVKYTPRIRKTCLKVIVTTISDSKCKKRALELLKIVLQKTDFFPSDDNNNINEIFKKLYVRFENSTGGVLATVTIVLGVLIKKYPSVVTNPNFYKDLVNKLERVVKTKDEEQIGGYFSCISDLLESYPDFDLRQLYKCMKELLEKELPYRKTGHRACLALVMKHTHLFADELYVDMWWWQQVLSKWLDLRGDDAKAGYLALDAFNQKLSKILASKNSEEDAALCSRIVSKFTEDINNSLLHGYKLRLSIRGLGFFADAVKVHLSPDEITTLFIDVVHRIEKSYLLVDPNSNPDQLENLPDYVQTLSNILKQLGNLTDYEVGVLQQATVLMIRLFPHLSVLHHNLVVNAILISLIHLRSCKKESFSLFLQNIVYQGIIWTCSHTPVMFAELQKETLDVITYKTYLPLWYSLLQKSNKVAFEKIDIDQLIIKQVTENIFDELMLALFVLTNKLNLNTQLKENTLVLTDPERTLEAVKANDFDIFINLVDFYVELLNTVDNVMFKKWILMYINRNIMKANKHPLVSGFYKLLSVALKICNNLNYFEESRLKSKYDLKICFDSVCSFIRHMVLKIKQYKGDLQIACLHVLLSAPISLVRDILPNIASTFVTVFTLGRSNLELAEMGIDTLEHWYQNVPEEELEPFLKEVLPSLDAFLTSKSVGESFDTQSLKTRKTKQILSRRKIITLTETELFNLQKRILAFVGRLNSDLCLSLVETNNIVEPITWSKSPHLKVSLPYEDVKLNIYLDNFVPRIVELALHCTERNVRINACEVLHSIVILTLGTAFSMNETKAKDLDVLLKKISYPLLQLGCDSDQTVRDIFEPLMIQLMHWYSNPQQKCSTHSAIIIETLMDGITQSSDCAVRDFTCTCIHEFIKWTIKQTTESGLQREPINIKIFTRKIKYFSLHTDPSKRLAAALMFNNMYTVLREESYVFNAFWIELLHSFVMNLSLIDEHDQYNCLDQVQQCLNHLERGFVEKYVVFNKAGKDRRIPPNFDGGLLKDVAVWLLKHTGSLNRHCRKRCIELFTRIAPLVDKKKNNTVASFMNVYRPFSNADWISNFYDHNIKICESYEEMSLDKDGLTKFMSSLLCALDGHIFVCENRIVPVEYNIYNNNFYTALSHFLRHVSASGFDELKTLTATEKEHLKNLKASVNKECLNFMIVLLRLNEDNVVFSDSLDNLLREHGWNLFCRFIFGHVSCSDDDERQNEITDLINSVKRYCPEKKVLDFTLVLNSYVLSAYKRNVNLKTNVTFQQKQIIQGLLLLQKSTLSSQLDVSSYTKGIVRDVFDNLIERNNGVLVGVNLQDSMKTYCELQLQFALENDEEFLQLARYLSDRRPVTSANNNDLTQYGTYIFNSFKHVLVGFLLKNWTVFFDCILSSSSMEHIYDFVIEILRYMEANKRNFDSLSIKNIVEDILLKWDLYKQCFEVNVERRTVGLEMLEKISRLVTEDAKASLTIDSVYKWIVESLCFDIITQSPQYALTFKTHVISTLPLVLGGLDDNKSELENALGLVQTMHFSDVPQSAKVAAVIAINKSFAMAIVSKSKLLFKFSSVAFTLADVEAKDVNIDHICKIYIETLDKDLQTQMLQCLYELCIDTTSMQPKHCYKLSKDVLINLIRYSDYSAFEQFYVHTIRQIVSSISSNNESVEIVTKKTVSYILIKALFSRIDVDKFQDKTCPITKAACSVIKDGKEFMRNVLKIATSALKENASDLSECMKEAFRIYLCHCYNALVCIISNTQKASIVYKMVFCRDVNGENVLWRNLIDSSKDYTFEMDFDKLPTETKTLVSIRTTRQAERKKVNYSQSVKYMESQHVFNSTLSEDVCQYDFTRSIVRSQPVLAQDADDERKAEKAEMTIDIDSVEINSHECMATICGLIQHMVDEDISPVPEGVDKLPDWMEYIKKELTSPNAPRNVKLFLVKVIEIMQHVFKPYAKEFYNPVIQLILDGYAGFNINYFVADLVVMLISWSENASSMEDVRLVSELLCFLIKNINSDRSDIMKYHLELMKTLVEPWKLRIDAPKDYIHSKLSATVASKKVDVIVHVCVVLLANNLAPWDSSKLKEYVKCLCKILDSEYMSVYKPCAAVIGMALHYIQSSEEDKLSNFENFMVNKLKKYDENKLLYALQEIMRYYPSIGDKFVNTFIYKFKNMSSDFKTICLKIFLQRVETLQNSYDFTSLDLNDLLLENNSVDAQVVGLEIIHKTVSKLSAQKLRAILDSLCKFATSTSHLCRSTMYDILTTIYDSCNSKGSLELADIVNKCRDVLLLGLVDHNAEIEEKVKGFWLNERNLPKNVFERFTYILSNMYKPSIEKHYLGYFIYFLLNDLTKSEEFTQTLFDCQLSECVFRDQNISANWRARHVSLAPMFASTYKSYETDVSMSSHSDPNFLRATQTLMEFEPTVQTQSIANEKFNVFKNTTDSTSLMDVDESISGDDANFKVPYPVSQKPRTWRRRFYKDQSKISRSFAFREVEKASKSEKKRRDTAKKREQSVQLYRRYRTGDFPDIEIKLSDVIVPLQKLAKSDTYIARQFYTTLFQGLFRKVSDKEGANQFVEETVQALNNIFTSSIQYTTNVMGAFLDIALTYKKIMQFHPETLSKLAQYSGLVSTGSLLLEEYLISADDLLSAEKKEKGYCNDPQVTCWVKLAELYKEMEEWDVVRSIFLEKMNCDDMVLKAIDAESQGFWKDAQLFYTKVIASDESLERKDFYYESYYKCFAELSDWENLSASIKSTVCGSAENNYWNELWDQDWNQQKLLPWYITAELRNSLENDKSKEELLLNLNGSLSDSVQSEYIKANFCEELAFLWLLQNDVDRAMYYLTNYIINFLNTWSNLNPLLVSLRANKVLKMRNALDIYNFVSKLKVIDKNNCTNVIGDVCNQWRKLFKENLSSIVSSETRNVYRTQFVNMLQSKLSSEFDAERFTDIREHLNDMKFDMDMHLVEIAVQSNNFYAAKKYIVKYVDYMNAEIALPKHVTYNLAYSGLLRVKALHFSEPQEQLQLLTEAWSNVENCLQHDIVKSDLSLSISTHMLVYDLTRSISNVYVNNKQISGYAEEIKALCYGSNVNSPIDIERHGVAKLQDILNSSSMYLDGAVDDRQNISKLMGEAYLKLAYFAYNNRDGYTSELISFILMAMYYGSAEAKQIFPCLLNVDNLGTEYRQVFLEQSRKLPEWMFIQWIPQLLANLDTKHVFAIHEIVVNIAKKYPQAIMYPYRLSKQNYKIEEDEVGVYCQEVMKTLDELLLSDPLVDKLLRALSSVGGAANILNYYLKKLGKACKEKSHKRFKEETQVIRSMFEEELDYDDYDSMRGAVFKTVLTYFDKILKLDTSKFDPTKVMNSLRKISAEVGELANQKSRHKNRLSFYSPWLEHFSENELNLDVEIPGQYKGDRKPLLQYHVKISGFSSEVIEFSSLRKPIKLTFIGSDAKEYPFVVKFGEDLRQDQRIEQMFGLINNILHSDAVCHEKRLAIRTYQVIPLTSSLGIIEFVGNTVILGDFVKDAMSASERKDYAKVSAEHVTKYLSIKPKDFETNKKEAYENALLKLGRDKTIAVYRGLVNSIPWDVFRKAIWNESVSSESFVALRNKFITSHSVACIANWILGIGDRHLDNTLVSLENGQIIDVDFGHAFGSSIQLLPVPELVPFRLTPHIINLMQPLNEHGLIQETMVHLLRALRKNAGPLLATMTVFIKEPSLEWVEFMSYSESTGQVRWCPETKMDQAKRKLEGANPATIMIEELNARSGDRRQVMDKYVEHVRGLSKYNVRARKEASSLSVEDQVKCLLDHATDYNLLGRMYCGWEPWI